jgi:hypothetical protein
MNLDEKTVCSFIFCRGERKRKRPKRINQRQVGKVTYIGSATSWQGERGQQTFAKMQQVRERDDGNWGWAAEMPRSFRFRLYSRIMLRLVATTD